MNKQLVFHQKAVEVKLSDRALAQSRKLDSNLLIEIQIYFSCLLGKRLAFYADQPLDSAWQVESGQFSSMLDDAQPLTDNIFVRFNTVMTKACPTSDYLGPPPVTDFQIKNQKPYVPCWLHIDYQDRAWSGEYGWSNSKAGQSNTRQVRGSAVLNTEKTS